MLFYNFFRSRLGIEDRNETEVINFKNCHSGLGKFISSLWVLFTISLWGYIFFDNFLNLGFY